MTTRQTAKPDLGTEPDENLIHSSTANERLAMMWELTMGAIGAAAIGLRQSINSWKNNPQKAMTMEGTGLNEDFLAMLAALHRVRVRSRSCADRRQRLSHLLNLPFRVIPTDMRAIARFLLSGFALFAFTGEGMASLQESTRSRLVAAAESQEALHSLLVLHEGDVVLEHSARGPGVASPANLKSLSKTILSVLVGIAIDKGLIESPDQPLVDLLGESVPNNATDGVNAITLGHALSLRTGLQSTSGRNYGRWVQSDNWVSHVLTRPMVDEPGGSFIYSTGSTHLAGAALAAAGGKSLLTLAREWLGEPLNIGIMNWMRDPQDIHFGGNEMHMSPLAVASIGEVYRLGGEIDGKRIVSEAWIEQSWTPRARSPWSGDLYGYGWFITEIAAEPTYYGRGYGGQMLYVVPSKALTVVITSRSAPPSGGGRYVRRLHGMVAQLIAGLP